MDEAERPTLPTAIRAIAYFTILCGIAYALTMVVSLAQGRLHLNIAVLQIPAGFGILRLSRGWRTFQLWMLWFGMIGFGILFLVLLIGRSQLSISGYGDFIKSRELLIVICAAMFALELWQYRVLTSREARLLFGVTVLSRARRPGGLRAGRGTAAGRDESSSEPPPGS